MSDRKLKDPCIYSEYDLDAPFESFKEDDHSALSVVQTISQSEEDLPSSFQPVDEDNKSMETPGNKEEEHFVPSQPGSLSSLHLYMKTLSQFPPLDEEEEVFFARKIKEQEKECLSLMTQWRDLFKKAYINDDSSNKLQMVKEKFQGLIDTFNFFDHLVKLEKKQKRMDRQCKEKPKNTPKKQEEIYRVKSEIAKGIAEINLSKKTINKIMRNLHKISQTRRQQMARRDLARILRKINDVSREIKALKNQLIQSHLRLVIFMAKRYAHGGLSLADLIQEGNLGLMRAIDTYDYNRSHRFIGYASWWIRQAFIRALNSKSMTIRKPVHISEKLYKINQASNRLVKERKREPTLEEIAKEANASIESIENVMQSFTDPVSLESCYEERGEGMVNLPQDNKSVFIPEDVILSSLSQTIDDVLSNLTPREKKIVKLRFGIETTHDHTLEEIGEEFGLSKERIRQILEVTLNKIKESAGVMKLKDFIGFN